MPMNISKRSVIIAVGGLIAVGAVVIGALGWQRSEGRNLEMVSASLAAAHPQIAHWGPSQLASAPGKTILIDVREADEFAVSHLRGSARLSPAASAAEALTTIPQDISGAAVVFYCSVGARSSAMAEKLRPALMQRGASAVVNLRGGIFAWHNGRQPLVTSGNKATEWVHPYNAVWGKLVNRSDLTRSIPEAAR